MKSLLITYLTIFLTSILINGCGENGKRMKSDFYDIDTLRVVTLYGPTSYFHYRGEEMGIEYENIRRFAQENGFELKVKVVKNISELIEELKEGESDSKTLKAFHDEILEGYLEIMSGDQPTLFKMKDLWTFLSSGFENSEKCLKKIRKANRIGDYRSAVEEVFAREWQG